MSGIIEQKINETKQLASDIEYLQKEFEGKLYGSCPDGDVKLHQMIAFAKEYDYILEHIIKISKNI